MRTRPLKVTWIWHQLRRDGHDIARCTVERLMKAVGIQGVVRSQNPIHYAARSKGEFLENLNAAEKAA